MTASEKKARIQKLVIDILRWKNAYYNLDKSLVSDARYDKAEDELRALDPGNKVLKMTGIKVKSQPGAKKTKKVDAKLPFPMGSMGKMRAGKGEVKRWAATHEGPWIVLDKVDGTALELGYGEGGKGLTEVYTRGDGRMGKDVSYLGPHLKVPAKCPYQYIRAEGVIGQAAFKAKWNKEFDTSRGMANGLMNRDTPHPAAHKAITLVIHEALAPRGIPSQQLAKLKTAGFTVPWFKKLSALTDAGLSNLLAERKKSSPYKIDGLVISQDRKTVLRPGLAVNKIAFKEESEEDQKKAKVLNVMWQVSKRGELRPVLNIEPTKMDEATIERVTAFNAKFVWDNKLGPGAVVQIARAGDVIPDIQKVLKAAQKGAQMPSEPWTWDKNKVQALVKGIQTHKSVRDARILSFFQTLGALNFGEGVVKKLIAAGFDNTVAIIKMTDNQWKSVPGFEGAMGPKLKTSLEGALTDVDLATLADATNIFGSGFGTRRFQAILDEYPNPRIFLQEWHEDVVAKISELHGFNTTTAGIFTDGLVSFYKWYDKIKDYVQIKEKRKVKGGKCKGLSVALTGFRDRDLMEKIEKAGGEASDSMTSKTNILLAVNPQGTSSKITRARAKGIPVMDPDAFTRKYGL